MQLKQRIHRWLHATERHTEAARACVAGIPGPERCPDLWAGTVQDTVAEGLAIRLDEALALCKPAPLDPVVELAANAEDDPQAKVFTGKSLRRQREYVVVSATSRVRITRKHGVHYLHRARGLDVPRWLTFDWRADPEGTLDGFLGIDGVAPRRFDPANLQASRYIQSPGVTVLEFEGRLGRGRIGFPVRMTWLGAPAHPGLRLRIEVDNQFQDHRLRLRCAGMRDLSEVGHNCPDVWQLVAHGGQRFGAMTIVRASGQLPLPDGQRLPTPLAQCLGWIQHDLLLGGSDCG